MSKPKKKRTKKYHPSRPKFPAWTLDTLGPLKELDFERLETAVKLDLGLIKMGTMDRRCYGNILYALRHFYSFSQNFENQGENELLATMGTAAVHTLLNLAEEVEAGKPKRPAVVAGASGTRSGNLFLDDARSSPIGAGIRKTRSSEMQPHECLARGCRGRHRLCYA